ncbi:PTS system, glucitol/sorbitol-specific IIA component [Enterococcus sp. DIV0765f]|uniref:PTS glucitol/sorbitol transporter subunit IIA n=1 Tax=Enterococcus TaxID=1350 RepID=UPI001FB9E815|nr:PTS glucitol/sorbitol transporter subunit IIA [Enterococcus mundtii]GKS53844.1 glucitol/sorbitol-specific PTS system IIA component [Enterococcus mundtii]
MSVYSTKVTSIGAEATLFKEEKLVILFGKDAPNMLSAYCYHIELQPIHGEIKVGQQLFVDETSYRITSVGSLVNDNLKELGHITIKFDGAVTPELPGTLYVEGKEIVEIGIKTKISIK